jgi:PPOX class probable F420-dependent enzyme
MREPAYCQLATLMPDGAPQNTQVWVETDGEHILVNTAEGRQKVNNVRRDPRVALNVVDPTNAWRIASVRGRVVDVTTEGADQLSVPAARRGTPHHKDCAGEDQRDGAGGVGLSFVPFSWVRARNPTNGQLSEGY